MKGFFQSMNFARGLILMSVIGALVLAVLGWRRTRELATMRQNLETDMPRISKQLVEIARKHSQLSETLQGSSLQGEANLQSYIRKVATLDRVEVGNVDLTSSEPPVSKGVVDKKYRIKPSERDRPFRRSTIANFLYSLEQQSLRVKVTEIKIETSEKRLKPHEVPEDMWSFEAEVTSRQRVEP